VFAFEDPPVTSTRGHLHTNRAGAVRRAQMLQRSAGNK
jgi:hypothetical protein